jgi:hypothetical protein
MVSSTARMVAPCGMPPILAMIVWPTFGCSAMWRLYDMQLVLLLDILLAKAGGSELPRTDYNLALDRNSQVHTMMTADAATINSAQIKVT